MFDFDFSDIDLGGIGGLALGAGLQFAANREQQRRRQALANQMQAYQALKAREGNAVTSGYIEAQNPSARAAETESVRAELERGLKESMGTAQAFERPEAAGKQSVRYMNTRALGNAEVETRLRSALENLARMNAPGERQLIDARRFNDAATTLNAAGTASRNVGDAYKFGINAAQPNKFLQFAGEVATGLGLAGLSKKKPKARVGHAQSLGYAEGALPQE